LKHFFNYQKSKQILTLKKYDQSMNKERNYFIKVLNMDFSFESILTSLKESENILPHDFIIFIEGILIKYWLLVFRYYP